MGKSTSFELEIAENGIIWRNDDFVSVAKEDEENQFIGSELISQINYWQANKVKITIEVIEDCQYPRKENESGLILGEKDE
jgi:hypothetical protein